MTGAALRPSPESDPNPQPGGQAGQEDKMEEAKKSRGRPPMEDRSKVRTLRGVRCSDTEHQQSKALAQKAVRSFSAFVRERALAKK